MSVKQNEYPAKLVGYRIDWTHARVVVFADEPVVFNDKELARRLQVYTSLEQAGGLPYTYQLVALPDLEATMADIRADLELQLGQALEWGQRQQEPRLVREAPSTDWPRRIDLIVAYEAEERRALPRINANGQLVAFKEDGRDMTPPSEDISQIYRWLQDHGYVPDGFKWLGWERGLRQRRQTYVLADERDTALPVQYGRGRSKLFKEVC